MMKNKRTKAIKFYNCIICNIHSICGIKKKMEEKLFTSISLPNVVNQMHASKHHMFLKWCVVLPWMVSIFQKETEKNTENNVWIFRMPCFSVFRIEQDAMNQSRNKNTIALYKN